MREERKNELEAHVEAVNAILKDGWIPGEEADAWEGEWGGISDDDEAVVPELVDHEEEYVDEDKYTIVTVEEVDVSRGGLQRVVDEESEDTLKAEVEPVKKEEEKKGKQWPKKPRKKKFTYESKAERKITRGKQKAGNKARADARRGMIDSEVEGIKSSIRILEYVTKSYLTSKSANHVETACNAQRTRAVAIFASHASSRHNPLCDIHHE